MKTKKIYMVYSVFLMLAGLLLFTAQGVRATDLPAGKYRTAADTLDALRAPGSTAVIFDVRTVDEHNGCQPPWLGTDCPDTSPPKGTPAWVVKDADGNDLVVKLPINIPFWNTTNWPNGNTNETEKRIPEKEAEVKAIIEGLLAAGVIDFDTEIHLLCRSAVRSHLMLHWIEDQGSSGFYNARTDTNGNFTNLYDIDSDGIEGSVNSDTSTYGGMKLWNQVEVGPLYTDYSGGVDNVPPQVFAKTPLAGATSNTNNVIFTISILEPTTGGFVYPALTDVSLYVDSAKDGNWETSSATDPTAPTRTVDDGIWKEYDLSATTPLPTGTYDIFWNASATNSADTSWNPHVLDETVQGPEGPGKRTLTVDAQPDITVTPASLDFYNVEVNSSKDLTLTVTNDGGLPLNIDTPLVDPSSSYFTIQTEDCAGQELAVKGSCTITVRFLPTATVDYPDSFSIKSDDPDEPTVKVSLTGVGAYLPTDTPSSDAPELVFPTNKGKVSSSLTFEWKPSTNAVSYKLFYCTDENFAGATAGCAGVDVTDDVVALGNNGVYYYAGGFGLLLFGIAFTGGVRERKKIMLLLVAVIISSGMLFVSCGDDDKSTVNTGEVERSAYKTYAVSGLASGTYYWGVTAVDGSEPPAQEPSAKWSFTVE